MRSGAVAAAAAAARGTHAADSVSEKLEIMIQPPPTHSLDQDCLQHLRALLGVNQRGDDGGERGSSSRRKGDLVVLPHF